MIATLNSCPDIAQLIDLRRYPLADPSAAQTREFVTQCRQTLATQGVVALDGFIPDAALERLREEWLPLLRHAYYTDIEHNCFLLPPDPNYAADHPRNRTLHNNKGGIADDLIPRSALLRQIYDWGPFRRFVAAVVEEEQLLPLADPLSSLNINVHQQGQVQGWHFDGAQFAVTLMLQTASSGGDFRYSRVLRDKSETQYESIARVLHGDDDGITTLSIAAGTLVIFRGHRALHCVSAPIGARPRVNAILSYAAEPGAQLAEHTRRLFYGRVD